MEVRLNVVGIFKKGGKAPLDPGEYKRRPLGGSMTANFQKSLLLSSSIAAFALAAGPAFAQAGGGTETVIVTGTRVQGMTAADSAAPITVLGTDALTHGSGTTDLRN